MGWIQTDLAGGPRQGLGRAHQGRAEAQDPVAVGGGALGEEDDGLALAHAGDHLVRRAGGGVAALAVDEDRALQPGEIAEERPGRDLRLGDEGERREGAEHHDVHPRDVVGHEERRAVRRSARPAR
jgi:hypothetical protein